MICPVSQRSERPGLEGDPPPGPPREFRGLAARGLPHYLEGLNDEQMRAVEALDGPVLVLAGAGVGKTRVLTTRIAHIIATGRARPHEILAVTFTNKAAREMRERVAMFTGSTQAMPWLGTFHSIGVKILRMHAELVGLRPNFTILDTDDQLRLLKQILQAENLDDKRWPARALASLIDGWKNRGLDPQHVPASEFGRVRRRPRRRPLCALPGPAQGAERRRLRRSPARIAEALSRARRHSRRASSAASATFWSTNTRTPTSSSICGSGFSPGPTAISAASATTTSRSTDGAAPTSTTSCASRRIFRARR